MSALHNEVMPGTSTIAILVADVMFTAKQVISLSNSIEVLVFEQYDNNLIRFPQPLQFAKTI